ncbi:hypothetical protein SAMN02910368_02609 [Lachnospiraceae bacterium G11]|nr:hypothetical protein SAMN02910368_02609 [Lachnospiraceae bacterium G11]
MSQINRTLLDKLFENPNPQPERPEVLRLFKELSYRMFPGKLDFITFLKTSNIDKQYVFSERIIHHLCYVSNFPPTYFAMTDVLSLETFMKRTYTEKDARDSFIPRDHFIHLVNLYLLGIYIFFYNSDFFNRIIKDNRFQRANEMVMQPYIGEIKDFISEWRYFVLYHDIGYVPEIFSNDLKISDAGKTYKELKHSTNDFQSSLSGDEVLRQTSFFGALEIMSKIFVAQLVLRNSTKKIDSKNICFRNFKRSNLVLTEGEKDLLPGDFDKVFAPTLRETYYLEKVFTNSCLKPLLSVWGSINIIVLGIAKQTGELAYISFCSEDKRKLIVKQKYKDNSEVQALIKNPQLVIYDDYRSVNFEHEYILKRDISLEGMDKSMPFSSDDISLALDIMDSDFSIKFAEINNEEQFFDFYYELYLHIYRMIRQYIVPGKTPQNNKAAKNYDKFINLWKCSSEVNFDDHRKLQENIYPLIKGSFSEEIEKSCMKYLQLNGFANEGNGSLDGVDNAIDQVVDSYVAELLSKLQSSEEIYVIKGKIKEVYRLKMEQMASVLRIYSYLYARLRHVFGSNGTGFAYSFNYKDRLENGDSEFCKEYIDRKKGNGTFEGILKYYKIPHGNRINHGFASAKYAAAMFSFFRNSIEAEKDEALDLKMVEILFDISNSEKKEEYRNKYIDDYDHIFENVLYAIFIHDVYPDKFQGGSKYYNMSTSITDAFSYLALVSDALQDWNRPQSLNSSLLDLRPYEHASDSFNIEVTDRGINVYEEGVEASQKRLEKMINDMKHLKNIKAHLKDGYVQEKVY